MRTRSMLLLLYSLVFISLCLLKCGTIVRSPHAQNELITPYNRAGEVHEIGIATAFNTWMISREYGYRYWRTYPSKSFSLFHNVCYAQGEFGGIGGIEVIGFPTTWYVSDAPGFIFGLKPYVGLQLSGSVYALRLNLAPLLLVAGIADGEWGTSGALDEVSLYQFTMLLHNRLFSKHTYWGGIRNSPAALGLIGGYEYTFTKALLMRLEYSYLMKPPFSLILDDADLESIDGQSTT